MKRDKDVMPVYDLASRLRREVTDEAMLCLVARHVDGPMAIRIDAEIPSLHNVETSQIGPSHRDDIETLGSFEEAGEEIAIVAVQRLGGSRLERVPR